MNKAVILDKDGVIVDNTLHHKKSWEKLLAEYKINLGKNHYSLFMQGRSRLETLKLFFPKKSEKELLHLATIKENFYKEIVEKDFRVVKGIVPFLLKLKEAKLQIGLATSSAKSMVEFTFGKLKIKQYFDSIVTSEDVSASKPDPQIYLKAAEKLRVNPNKCVVFEDSRSGVNAAIKAGMKVVLVMTTHKSHEIKGINLAINDFTEITPEQIIGL